MITATDFRSLANAHIRDITPYQPGKPLEELERELGIHSSIKLASNENPLGASQAALDAANLALFNAHIYPDGSGYELKQTLAQFINVTPEQLTLGNGSENILELIIKSYLRPGLSAVISQYAFLTIPILIKSYGVTMHVAPAKNWGHDVDAMINLIDENTRVLFLVNPNNPTGTFTNKNDFEKLLNHVPPHVIIVVDEAYSEYIADEDYPDALLYLARYPNLIICRTFSKVYGLAALRLGYAISSLEIADILNRSRLPFNVNTIAAKAGCAALKDQNHVKKSVALNDAGMKQFEAHLTEMKLEYIPSLGNFVTINVKRAKIIYDKLLLLGVIVRPLMAYDMPQHIRVTIGTLDQNERFFKSLHEIKSEII